MVLDTYRGTGDVTGTVTPTCDTDYPVMSCQRPAKFGRVRAMWRMTMMRIFLGALFVSGCSSEEEGRDAGDPGTDGGSMDAGGGTDAGATDATVAGTYSADLDGTNFDFPVALASYNSGIDAFQISGAVQMGNLFTTLNVNIAAPAVGTFPCEVITDGSNITYLGPDLAGAPVTYRSVGGIVDCTIDVTAYGSGVGEMVTGTFSASVQESGGNVVMITNGVFDVARTN